MKKRFFGRKSFWIKLIIIVAAILLIINFWAYYQVTTKYQNFINEDLSKITETRVALILGAGLKVDGTPSDVLADRVRTASNLYLQGKVKKLLMSGDNGRKAYNEVMAMKKMAVELGVKEEDVTLDYAGFRTYDSCYRAKEIFSLTEAIIVTQRFHLARALYLCNEMGIKSVGIISDRHLYVKANYFELREIAAKIVSWWQVNVFKTKPKYLGKKEQV